MGVENIGQGLALLAEKAPVLRVVVKDGKRGAAYWDHDQMQYVPVERIIVAGNMTGAGDSFNAGVLAAVGRGYDVLASIRFGCMVAAAHISGEKAPEL